MLLPNQGIRGDGVEISKITWPQGPQCDELPFQVRLQIKWHTRLLT
jgi:hypothetical protein